MANAPVDDDLGYVQSGMGTDLDTLVVFNLLRTHSHLAPFVDADLRQQNLTAAQLNTLLVLRAAGQTGRLMSEIGELLVVTKSNVTGLVDRLESQGLVARGELPDRRATVVRLTPAGEQLLEQVAPRHAEWLTELMGCLTESEKRTLIRLLSKLRQELRQRRKARQRSQEGGKA